MREIKFRGRGNHGWYCGLLSVFSPDSDLALINNVEVELDTIGQFTGLKDCNGQEIFEGDILLVKAENPYWSKFDSKHVVTWYNDGWILNDYGTDDSRLFHILMNNNCEVIGNVYDNPELLEVTK